MPATSRLPQGDMVATGSHSSATPIVRSQPVRRKESLGVAAAAWATGRATLPRELGFAPAIAGGPVRRPGVDLSEAAIPRTEPGPKQKMGRPAQSTRGRVGETGSVTRIPPRIRSVEDRPDRTADRFRELMPSPDKARQLGTGSGCTLGCMQRCRACGSSSGGKRCKSGFAVS